MLVGTECGSINKKHSPLNEWNSWCSIWPQSHKSSVNMLEKLIAAKCLTFTLFYTISHTFWASFLFCFWFVYFLVGSAHTQSREMIFKIWTDINWANRSLPFYFDEALSVEREKCKNVRQHKRSEEAYPGICGAMFWCISVAVVVYVCVITATRVHANHVSSQYVSFPHRRIGLKLWLRHVRIAEYNSHNERMPVIPFYIQQSHTHRSLMFHFYFRLTVPGGNSLWVFASSSLPFYRFVCFYLCAHVHTWRIWCCWCRDNGDDGSRQQQTVALRESHAALNAMRPHHARTEIIANVANAMTKPPRDIKEAGEVKHRTGVCAIICVAKNDRKRLIEQLEWIMNIYNSTHSFNHAANPF